MTHYLKQIKMAAYPVVTGLTLLVLSSCGGGDKQAGAPGAGGPPQVQSYPVFSITPQNATLNTDYPASLQGEQNIEIRPKVDGFVDKIFIDEGSVVKIGQPLFSIKAPQYEQDVRNAAATISSAEADVSAAQLQVNKTKPLVDKDIISHFELESAQYTLQARKAALAQAKTTLAIARTNLGYTNIISPVNGVVGSIPYKIGSLVSSTNTQPLTTVSSIGQVYAYFSLNEKQLLDFSRNVKGKTLNQKLANTPAVTLILSDGSTYPEPGRIKTINGQINTETGAASFRATFPNPVGLLRSGSSASVRIPQQIKDGILVPQKSTYELQGKRFIYLVDQSGAVKSTEIEIMDKTAGQYFVVTKGLKAGDKVVYDGTSSLKDATKIKSEEMPADKVYQDLK
ncbi:efflux RND transporter periplasmic adaptor subunit [Mucilaginibacter glaciei]|nr:efflux RND transporter periplasmic adaptor subunit [Mucilaginibacter glaciei]